MMGWASFMLPVPWPVRSEKQEALRQHFICSKISLSRTGSRTKQTLDLNQVPLHLFTLSAFTSLSIASAETHRHCYLLVAASVAKQHSPQLYFSFPSLSMAPQRGSCGRGRRASGSGTSAFPSPSPLVRNSSARAPSHASGMWTWVVPKTPEIWTVRHFDCASVCLQSSMLHIWLIDLVTFLFVFLIQL